MPASPYSIMGNCWCIRRLKTPEQSTAEEQHGPVKLILVDRNCLAQAPANGSIHYFYLGLCAYIALSYMYYGKYAHIIKYIATPTAFLKVFTLTGVHRYMHMYDYVHTCASVTLRHIT